MRGDSIFQSGTCLCAKIEVTDARSRRPTDSSARPAVSTSTRGSRSRARVITHAHGDHARPGSAAYLCASRAPACSAAASAPTPPSSRCPTGSPITMGGVRVSFHPAGHVLGSAQVRHRSRTAGRRAGSGSSPATTSAPRTRPASRSRSSRCDTFITESTFGLPIYRWDPTATVIDEILAWWGANESQRKDLGALLLHHRQGAAHARRADARYTDRPVLVHGMMLGAIDAYREAGVAMLPVRAATERPRGTSFAGELVLAPLSARGTPWMRRLRRRVGCVRVGPDAGPRRPASARLRSRVRPVGPRRLARAARTVEETGASRVLATHGHAEAFARVLSARNGAASGKESDGVTAQRASGVRDSR